MNAEMRQKLREIVVRYQEFKRLPYVDKDDQIKIGFQHNLNRNGITINQALDFLNEDLQYYMTKLSQYMPTFISLPVAKQTALIALCHFLGWQNVLDQSVLIDAIEQNEFDVAATELIKLGYVDLAFLMRSKDL